MSTTHIKDATTAFDTLMYEALSDLVSGPLPDWSWSKASLPISLGGLGIRNASLHSSAAYIGSITSSQPLVSEMTGRPIAGLTHLPEAFRTYSVSSQHPEWSSPDAFEFPLFQRHLSRAIDQSTFDLLLSDAPTTRAKALALSSAIPHAGDWLTVIPSPPLGLHLHDQEFRRCLQYWLGVKMFSDNYPCPFCKTPCDPYGDHHIECGGNKDRIHRHDSIRDILYSSAQTAALGPRKEMPSLIPGSRSRPADIYLPLWTHGKPAAIDVSVISPLQKLTIARASTTQGHAITVGEDRKLAAHSAACQEVGVNFIPLITEAIGGWGEGASQVISSIGRLMGQRLGSDINDTTRHLFQRLAMSLWRGNAAMWLARSPTPPPFVDGVL